MDFFLYLGITALAVILLLLVWVEVKESTLLAIENIRRHAAKLSASLSKPGRSTSGQ